MKTLFISDLDGTLLSPDASVSPYTADVLSAMEAAGHLFTVATARTAVTVRAILKGIPLSAPVILMNGALIYDMGKGEYINSLSIDKSALSGIITAMESVGFTGFMYGFTGSEIISYYTSLLPGHMENLYASRLVYKKTFKQVSSLSIPAENQPIVYISAADEKEKVLAFLDYVKRIDNISYVVYGDNYVRDLWYLEIFSQQADKRHGVEFLKEHFGFQKIVAFGDNNNDLPMFDIADECYAVGNAVDALKEKATDVIGSNNEDGVAKWLEKNIL